jgi:hypothetical protein
VSFKIIDVEAFADYEMDDSPRIFESPKDARIAAQNLGIIFQKKYDVRPYAPPSDDWKDREARRFEDGTYTKVLPSLQEYCLPEHFVHVSKGDPEKIAYTQNPFKGSNGIQTKSTIIGYLEKYAKHVSSDKAGELQDEHDTAFSFIELKIAKTPEEMIHVYTNYDPTTPGVSDSCMRGKDCRIGMDDDGWLSQVHPISVYGNSDLELAYIENAGGKVIARALTYPKNMVYSRCYGSNDSTNKLHRFLKKKGYSKSQDYYGRESNEKYDINKTLQGARINAIRWGGTYTYNTGKYSENDKTYFVMPYIDEYDIVTLMLDENGKEYFSLGVPRQTGGLGYMPCRSTNGVNCLVINNKPIKKVVTPPTRRSL